MHPTHVLAYAPADNYMNQHQNVAMWVGLLFIGLVIFGLLRLASGGRRA